VCSRNFEQHRAVATKAAHRVTLTLQLPSWQIPELKSLRFAVQSWPNHLSNDLHPERVVELAMTGDTRAFVDGPRVQRLLGNLVVNALKYGAQDAPVRVVLTAEDADVRFEVRNSGIAIDPLTLEQLFEPLKRGSQPEDRYSRDGSLGLGLYIAREIARAHGGEIEARSENTETVFVVRLPR
jgi:signal transduction histidine kinase